MFKAEYKGRPKPAERPRPRLGKNAKFYYMYNPPTYQQYKQELIEFFNQFESDKNFYELFDPKKVFYGLSLKVVFRFKASAQNPFYTKRPDLDNVLKAVQDALFQCKANLVEDGFMIDKGSGELILDENGQPIINYKQRIDDCRVVHFECLKLRVDTEEEEGFLVTLRNVGKDEIQ